MFLTLNRFSLINKKLIMPAQFKVGDHVSWNSEAGRVSGNIIKVHTEDFDYKGHTHHASDDEAAI